MRSECIYFRLLVQFLVIVLFGLLESKKEIAKSSIDDTRRKWKIVSFRTEGLGYPQRDLLKYGKKNTHSFGSIRTDQLRQRYKYKSVSVTGEVNILRKNMIKRAKRWRLIPYVRVVVNSTVQLASTRWSWRQYGENGIQMLLIQMSS